MDIRNVIEKLLSEENPRRAYAMLETLVLKVLKQYIEEQGKEFISNYTLKPSPNNPIMEYDGYAPDGLDNFDGGTIFEFKFFRNKNSLLRLFREKAILSRLLKSKMGIEIKNLILIVTLELTHDEKKAFLFRFKDEEDVNIVLWDINDLVMLLNKYPELVLNLYDNISQLLINSTISDSITKDKSEWKIRRDEHIEKLKRCFLEDDLVLFLGSGVSRDSQIPTWDNLVSDLLVSLISVKLGEYSINLTDDEKGMIIQNIKDTNGNSPLQLARYIRKGLENVFVEILTDVLYKNCINKSPTLEALSQICLPVRNGVGLQGVVTYNFDDLLEHNLDELGIRHRSVYRESDIPLKHELGIYHVHGFLPRDTKRYENLSKSLLVFSEEGYHNIMLDPYNWSNLVQLNYLRENTCLLIGLSLTDPNLRRLLDIAMRKQEGNLCKHFVILKRESFAGESISTEGIKKFDMVNQDLQEEYFKELGLNVIWIEKHEEIPNILRRLKE